jgi:hypothetical protein
MPQIVAQSKYDRGEDDILNKFNNLLNKVGSKPPVDKPVDPLVFDEGTQFNPLVNDMGTQVDNPIFNDGSNNIEIIRKPDLSNQNLLENIKTPAVDEPDENESLTDK